MEFQINHPLANNREYMEQQFRFFMGEYTNLSLEQVYEIYTRPGAGGKPWTKKEKQLFELIKNMTGQENPYGFRFM